MSDEGEVLTPLEKAVFQETALARLKREARAHERGEDHQKWSIVFQPFFDPPFLEPRKPGVPEYQRRRCPAHEMDSMNILFGEYVRAELVKAAALIDEDPSFVKVEPELSRPGQIITSVGDPGLSKWVRESGMISFFEASIPRFKEKAARVLEFSRESRSILRYGIGLDSELGTFDGRCLPPAHRVGLFHAVVVAFREKQKRYPDRNKAFEVLREGFGVNTKNLSAQIAEHSAWPRMTAPSPRGRPQKRKNPRAAAQD